MPLNQDTAFWQKSFATEVKATVPGYDIAALAIFGIPWGFGTVIGLTARAIQNTPIFPTYPGILTTAEVNSGLVMPYVVKALIGRSGIIAFFILLFMALTSTISSSMIAVSSILSFDLYKTYINPKVSDKRLVHISHLAVILHAVLIVAISLILNYGGADMTWIGYFRPIISCPGIIPLIFTLCWRGQTRLAAILSPILGFATGVTIWLVTAKKLYGSINLTTTESGYPALYGACGSLFSPAIYSILISQYKPYKFDWREFLRVELAEEVKNSNPSTPSRQSESVEEDPKTFDPIPELSSIEKAATPLRDRKHTETATVENEKNPSATDISEVPPSSPSSLDDIQHPFNEETLAELYRWYKIAWIIWIVVVLVTFVAWPMPLYRDYVFSKAFFSGWVVVAIAWTFFAFFAVVIYPLYDGRQEIAKGSRGVWDGVRKYFGR